MRKGSLITSCDLEVKLLNLCDCDENVRARMFNIVHRLSYYVDLAEASKRTSDNFTFDLDKCAY